MISKRKLSASALAAAVGFAAATMSIAAPAVAEIDFSGQRIEVIVPFGEGGGADTYTRYMARALGPFLPGKPTVVIRNMPGGGSVNGANWFHRNAKTDGTHFTIASTTTLLTFALEPEADRIQFSVPEWTAFIGSPMGRAIYVHSSTGITSLEDLRDYDRELFMGLQSPTGSALPTILALHMLGTDTRAVFGTDGGDAILGFERGELTINADVTSAFFQTAQPMIDSGTAVPLFSFGYYENGEIVRDPNFPDLPSFPEAYEIVHGEPPSGPDYEAWLALFHISVMSSKALALPPGVSQEIIDVFTAAAAALAADETFLAESGEMVGTYPQIIGADAQDSMIKAVTLSPEARAFLTQYLRDRFDVNI